MADRNQDIDVRTIAPGKPPGEPPSPITPPPETPPSTPVIAPPGSYVIVPGPPTGQPPRPTTPAVPAQEVSPVEPSDPRAEPHSAGAVGSEPSVVPSEAPIDKSTSGTDTP
jgi:hypothetical protein